MFFLSTHSELEDLSAGQFRHVQHLRPVAYQDSGSLHAIVNDWTDSGVPARPHAITSAPFLVTCSGNGMRRIHPTREIDRYFEIGAPYVKIGGVWQQANLGAPVRSGNLLQWTTANANMYVRMAGHFIKLALLLKSGWIPEDSQFAFPVGLVGLTRSDRQILADGDPVMSFRAPYVKDFDNPLDVRPIASQFVQLAGRWYVLFTLPDLSGMSRPLIDPTLELQPDAADGDDTELVQGAANNNYGILFAINAGNSGAIGATATRSMIRFDLSSIPASATIDTSTLEIYFFAESTATNRNVAVHRALTQWWEGNQNGAPPPGGVDGSTWNHRNANGAVAWTGGAGGGSGSDFAAVATDTVLADTPPKWLAYNVLADVAVFVSGAVTNYGWWLMGEEGFAGSLKAHYSSDWTTPAERPKLTIDYTVAGGQPIFATSDGIHSVVFGGLVVR